MRNDKDIIKELVSVANSLDSKGFFKEADKVDDLIKAASTAPSIPRFKELLGDVLRNAGYTVSDKPGSDIQLDPNNPRWTRNLTYAWERFSKNVLQIDKAAENWAAVASKIGRGYRGNLGGMIDLLYDFTQGGRAQAGGSLANLGEAAEQTPELIESIESDREVNTALEPFGIVDEMLDRPDSRKNRSRLFSEKNERLLREQRARMNQQNTPKPDELPGESDMMAKTPEPGN